MNCIEIETIDDFFCPLTGQQILSEDDFNPSPAVKFIFTSMEWHFAYVDEDSAVLLNELSFKEEGIDCNDYLRFEGAIMAKCRNLVLFKIHRGREYAIVCLDMDYSK